MKPLAIDLFTGLHGWLEAFLVEGYRCIGFDIVDMCKELGVKRPDGINLVLQDVLSLDGSQFRNATVIVASPPCQAYSYRAMPWKRAKSLPPPDNTLFEACFRIQREASEAAGRYIPLIVENVRGAQKWVGRARANFGSYYLWGDVGMVGRRVVAGVPRFGVHVTPMRATKIPNQGLEQRHPQGISPQWRAKKYGIKQHGSGREWFAGEGKISRITSSHSPARKAASALIAKVPFPLAQYVARAFKDATCTAPV